MHIYIERERESYLYIYEQVVGERPCGACSQSRAAAAEAGPASRAAR